LSSFSDDVLYSRTSAADLKFLHHCRKLVQQLQIDKRHARDQQKWSPVLRPAAR
jgi:hypothetical protein